MTEAALCAGCTQSWAPGKAHGVAGVAGGAHLGAAGPQTRCGSIPEGHQELLLSGPHSLKLPRGAS